MDVAEVDRKLEVLSGQIEALRTTIVAIALLSPRKAALREAVEELLLSQRDRLLSEAVSDAYLEGLDSAAETILMLIRQGDS